MKTAWTILALLLPAAACRQPLRAQEPSQAAIEQFLAAPQNQLKNYAFDPALPLESRIGPTPPIVLEFLRRIDDRPDYQAYTLTPKELAVMHGYLVSLPAGMRKVFQERLVGIYFIEPFMGNGLGSWLVDDKKKVYAWIVLNHQGLRRGLSETLTARDASVFKGDAGVKVDCGGAHPGVAYTLLHEGTHIYDYVRGITPFVERMMVHALRDGKGLDASWDAWERIDKPRKDAAFPLRDKLTFFGLGKGPRLKPAQARRLYSGLAQSPFASLYGSQTWAEDAADLATFYHITQVLKQPYIITVPGKGGREALTVEPLKAGKALERARRVYGQLER
ncbi:MAG: hypothetical protein HY927_14475 [Elusimicrobia bacterium]|nr:hypothetical protein [Elusimicrobiota bacterium]